MGTSQHPAGMPKACWCMKCKKLEDLFDTTPEGGRTLIWNQPGSMAGHCIIVTIKTMKVMTTDKCLFFVCLWGEIIAHGKWLLQVFTCQHYVSGCWKFLLVSTTMLHSFSFCYNTFNCCFGNFVVLTLMLLFGLITQPTLPSHFLLPCIVLLFLH